MQPWEMAPTSRDPPGAAPAATGVHATVMNPGLGQGARGDQSQEVALLMAEHKSSGLEAAEEGEWSPVSMGEPGPHTASPS